jgi:ERO1-like protein beta
MPPANGYVLVDCQPIQVTLIPFQGPNLQCFINRVASHPERLQYIYFDTVLLLRAVARIAPYLSSYDYCSTGAHEDDAETALKVKKVVDVATKLGRFDESVLFRGENANVRYSYLVTCSLLTTASQVLKEEFKTHFRNVTRIMDCVGCDKCRLWGKVQTTGIATALKILFELDEKALECVFMVSFLFSNALTPYGSAVPSLTQTYSHIPRWLR